MGHAEDLSRVPQRASVSSLLPLCREEGWHLEERLPKFTVFGLKLGDILIYLYFRRIL